MSEDKTALTIVTLQSLELMEKRRAELVARDDRYACADDLMLVEWVISKMRAEQYMQEHLARALDRIDKLENSEIKQDELIQAVVRDHAETRRLALSNTEEIQAVGATIDTLLNRINQNLHATEEQGREVRRLADGQKKHGEKISTVSERVDSIEDPQP